MRTLKPRKANEDLNVTKDHPLVAMSWMLAGLAIVMIMFVFLSGFIVDYVAENISHETEEWIWDASRLSLAFDTDEMDEELDIKAAKVQSLLDSLPKDGVPAYDYKIIVVKDKVMNAIAAPGGRIIITTGLLEHVKSENGLVMVLGHELGHFVNRDHLKGLGRGVSSALFFAFIIGDASTAKSLLSGMEFVIQSKHSRDQERSADIVGIETLNKHYGHVGGASEFFEGILEGVNGDEADSYFSSHPLTQERVDKLDTIITDKGYLIKDLESKSW